MSKLKAVWQLMRLEHGVMLFLGILVGSLLSQQTLYGNINLPLVNVVLTFFTALFLEASTFALNDYYDLEIDRINKRTDRPLVRGDLSPRSALFIFYVFFPLGLLCSFFVNGTCFIIALITALLSVFYDMRMKKIKLIGNFYIAYIMAIPFIFGGVSVLPGSVFSVQAINPVIYIVALIAFLAGSGREIMKDVQDFEGDKGRGVRSFPLYIGTRASAVVAALFYLSAIALSFLPFSFQVYNQFYANIYYLGVVLVCDSMLLSISIQLVMKRKPPMGYLRKFSLLALFLGLIAFLVGVFTG